MIRLPAELLARATALARPGQRHLLGITGAPGAGKSTLAAALVTALGQAAVLVPMDGFHLAQIELDRLGRRARKGAPDTFDADGYLAMLRRMRDQHEDVVYAPTFDRAIEEPIAGAIPVRREVPLVVTEGNYLLLQMKPWVEVRQLLDEVWYVDADEEIRRERLISRHVEFGRTLAEARERAGAGGSDGRNAVLIAATRGAADLVVPW